MALTAAGQAGPPAATALFPAGGGRGQTVEVTAVGSFDAWPVKAWVDEPGLEIEPGAEKGKFTVRVSADAPPGVRRVRFFDEQGAGALLPFEVGTVPGIVETEPNDGPSAVQALGSLPAVVDGRLGKRGDVDGFAVTLDAGQTLVASLKGHRLGSPMDAVLQLVSPAGFILQQVDDEVGLDPRIVYEVPEAGTYVVRCFAFPSEPNSTIGFAGDDSFIYRLTLTAGPFLDHVLPLAAAPGEAATEVEAFGWNLGDDVKRLRGEPTGVPGRVRVWHPSVAESVELAAADSAPVVEANGPSEGGPQTLTPPASVSGRIGVPGERDVYRFTAKEGQVLRIRAAARELGSSLDAVVRVLDADGKVLAEQDDHGGSNRDVDLTLTAPRDGECRVAVTDLTGRGGMRFYYRLDVSEPVPDFVLTLAEDRVTVAPGKPATVAVTVSREQGFDRPIEITVLGLPGSVTAAPVRDEGKAMPDGESGRKKRGRGGDAARSTTNLTLTAGEGATSFSGPITVVGRAMGEEPMMERTASAAGAASVGRIDSVWLTVVAAPKE